MPTTVQTDTADAFDWDTIETIRNPDLTLFRIQTTYDTGLIQSEYYSNDILSSVSEDDSASQLFHWASRSVSYDETGIVTDTSMTLDTGETIYDSYVDGIIATRIENDWGAENQHAWSRILSSFDAAGVLYRALTSYDDTSRKIEYFVDGAVQTSQLFDTTDDSQIWDVIQTNFNTATGALERRATTYDDGVRRIEEFDANGERIAHQMRDDGDTRNWDTIDYYEDPQSNGRVTVTTYDTGVVREDFMNNGRREQIVQTDVVDDDGGTATWTTITTYFDVNGGLAARITTYDNGGLREEFFDYGVPTQTTQTDALDGDGGAQTWETINTYYDVNGELEARITQNDDGTTREDFYQGGALYETHQYDNSPGGEAQSWQEIHSFHDNGALAVRATIYDDGLDREEIYANGQREQIVLTDRSEDGSARSYQTLHIDYDDNGQIAQRGTLTDDGVERTETYANGQRIETMSYDREDAFNWSSRGNRYDDNGTLELQGIEFDNGTQRLTVFENGVRVLRADEDLGDAFDWSEKFISYDETGERTSSSIEYDNRDTQVDVFEQNLRMFRVEADGDGSETWAARVTEYGADGSVSQRSTYDTLDELPDDYAGYVNWAMVGF